MAADVEQEIFRLLDAGDGDGAVTHAIRAYGPQILGYLAAVLRDEDEANDAFSLFAEDLWSGVATFRRACTFRTWAYRLAWHAAMRHARDPYKKRKKRLDTSAVSKLVADVRSTTAIHLKDEVKDRFAKVRATLAPEDQTLLVLRVDRKLSWDEIAIVLSTDEAPVAAGALRVRYTRLKDKLKKALET